MFFIRGMENLVANFNHAYYTRNSDYILGTGAYGDVTKATAKEEHVQDLRREGLPEELAVKITKWRDKDCKHKNSEFLLIKKGFKFEHKNIVRVFHISVDKMINVEWTRQTIWMELCEQDLKEFQKRNKILLPGVRHVLKSILDGLAYIHDNGVIHRDLKEANVLLKKMSDSYSEPVLNYNIKLGDFNISKHQENKRCMTNTEKMGTESYRAPEVSELKNEKCMYGLSADIWSLGILGFRLWTGKKFPIIVGKSGDEAEIRTQLEKIQEDELKNFLKHCLRVNQAERYTAAQLLDHAFLKKRTSNWK